MAQEFDHKVHHYSKEGKIVSTNPYRLVINQGGREYERPSGSGMWYNADGSLKRDESAEIKAREAAKQAAEQAEAKAKADVAAAAERARIKAEVKAEIELELKGKSNGISSKA